MSLHPQVPELDVDVAAVRDRCFESEAAGADAAETANVTAELAARGYSREDIAKLWGGNLLRVWREAERKAAELARLAAPAQACLAGTRQTLV